MTFRIYHGQPSRAKLEKCNETAPSVEHGAEWVPGRMTDHGVPWILDNGAYSGSFDAGEWTEAIEKAQRKMGTPPEFVVLPDKFQDWAETVRRHEKYAECVPDGWDYAVVAQPPADPEAVVPYADRLGASTVFVGGGLTYTDAVLRDMVAGCAGRGLKCHVGEPVRSLSHYRDIGVDSVDTTRVVRNQRYDCLRTLENTPRSEQQTLGQSGNV